MKKRFMWIFLIVLLFYGCHAEKQVSDAESPTKTNTVIETSTDQEKVVDDTTTIQTTKNTESTTEIESQPEHEPQQVKDATLSDTLQGTYNGTVFSGAVLQIKEQKDGTYFCYVDWFSSHFEDLLWNFSGNFVGDTIYYENGQKWRFYYDTSDDEEKYTRALYENGTGTLKKSGNELIWEDENEPPFREPITFVKISDDITITGKVEEDHDADLTFGYGVYARKNPAELSDVYYYCFYTAQSGKVIESGGKERAFYCEQNNGEVKFTIGYSDPPEVLTITAKENDQIFGDTNGKAYTFELIKGADPVTFDCASEFE